MKSKQQNSTVFPKGIGNYSFIRPYGVSPYRSEYSFGLYQNKKGKKAICKLTTKNKISPSTFWLKNEIHIYEFLLENKNQIYTKFHSVRFPDLLSAYESPEMCYLLLEFIDGKSLAFKSVSERVKAYEQILATFQSLSTNSIQGAKLLDRGGFHQVLLFHFYLINALIIHPRQAITLLSNLQVFYRSVYFLLNKNDMVFCHRDLGENNILTSKDLTYVIDFQIAAISNRFTEIANIITTKWSDKEFLELFLESPTLLKIRSDHRSKLILSSLLYYNAIFKLSKRRNKKVNQILDFISAIKSL